MIITPVKFQVIIFDKSTWKNSNQVISTDQRKRKAVLIQILGREINERLNFNQQINNICTPASNKLNSLVRLKCKN